MIDERKVKENIKEIIQENVDCPISLDEMLEGCTLRELNINSLMIMKVFVKIEAAFDIEFNPEELMTLKLETLSDLFDFVAAKVTNE